MDSIENVLKDYFKDLNSREHHSNLSWENCYKFFYNNHEQIIVEGAKSDLLELAALELAFYLASWGMYRGSAFIRRYDHTVFKKLILQLLRECKNLWNDNITWEDLQKANSIIFKYFTNLKKMVQTIILINIQTNKPTQTLTTKFLMGIFGCVPAYDRYFVKALKEHGICQTYNPQSYKELKDWWKKENYSKKHILTNSDIAYPPMKLVDVYFWSVGKILKEKET